MPLVVKKQMTRVSFYPRLWKALWRSRAVAGRVLAVGLVLVTLVLAGQLYGYGRSFLALVMFAVILWVGIRSLHTVSHAPPEPEPVEVAEYGLKYMCLVCGLELRLEVATHDKAPRHCMEPMVLVREGGRPPLRPVK